MLDASEDWCSVVVSGVMSGMGTRQHLLVLRVRVLGIDSVDNICVLVVDADKWVPG